MTITDEIKAMSKEPSFCNMIEKIGTEVNFRSEHDLQAELYAWCRFPKRNKSRDAGREFRVRLQTPGRGGLLKPWADAEPRIRRGGPSVVGTKRVDLWYSDEEKKDHYHFVEVKLLRGAFDLAPKASGDDPSDIIGAGHDLWFMSNIAGSERPATGSVVILLQQADAEAKTGGTKAIQERIIAHACVRANDPRRQQPIWIPVGGYNFVVLTYQY